MNRLAGESSPYLLQHKDNPVHWYPWGPEALAAAHDQDKPILLSVGYAACHWCHVMERESFEDPETAELMNRWFINIKVDREERPDIDSIYMTALQATSGHGGWPMTVFATPAGEPIYTGTYFPKDDRPGHPSFQRVLTAVAEAWENQREDLNKQAAGITAAVDRAVAPTIGEAGEVDLEAAYRAHLEAVDQTHGGFGGAPKFPQPPNLEFLLRAGTEPWATDARPTLAFTLEKMANGGIYDQLGGGFARYSVDRIWLVPHFEKMLYDNANLARVYLRTGQVSANPNLTRIAVETLDYMIRDLGLESGGFASSEDADSEGEEGRFYVFTADEFRSVVGQHADALGHLWGVTDQGNFEGKNILHRAAAIAAVAARFDLDRQEVADEMEAARSRLLEYRNQRVRPGLDDKVVTAWNGLAVRALAEAGAVLRRHDYLEAAAANAEFVLTNLVDPDGRLHRTWRQGVLGPLAVLEDYAGYINGLLALYQATGHVRWFSAAEDLIEAMLDLFFDGDAFFATGRDAEPLITRPTDVMDNPSPSGNSLAYEALQTSAMLTGDTTRLTAAQQIAAAAAQFIDRHPTAVGYLLAAMHTAGSDRVEVAITGSGTGSLEEVVWDAFRPEVVVAPMRTANDADAVPLLAGRGGPVGPPQAHVCRNFACDLPVSEPHQLADRLP